MLVCVNTADREDKSGRGESCRGLHFDKVMQWIFQLTLEEPEYEQFLVVVVYHDNQDDNYDQQSKQISCSRKEKGNSAVCFPPKSWESPLCKTPKHLLYSESGVAET